ncbi:unnamed protein product [Mytilus edulis]|uniref:Uncharacterized protein n=1 Tax=Mytilus edulis TaxID=6550 RepID=A0A8S3R139_MYTED|nr:unnamed protein product [Mytilus edulis]
MKCVKYECSVAGCSASCRRIHDIKIHLVRQHYMTDMRLIQVLVPDSAGSPERENSSNTNSAKQISPSDKAAQDSPSLSVRSTKQLSSVVISNQQSSVLAATGNSSNEDDGPELTVPVLRNMDSLGRARQVAKERLETFRKEGSKLELERKKRREVEVENRRLLTELADLKWKDQLFRNMEP